MKRASFQDVKLTLEEVRGLLLRLARKYDKYGVQHVGFGTAKKSGKFNPARGLSVVFFVRRKIEESALSKTRILPKTVSTVVVRGVKRVRTTIPVDVVERVGRVRRTGYSTTKLGANNRVTSGVVVSWSTPGDIEQWGIVTVSHFLDTGVSFPMVKIVPANGTPIFGTVSIRLPNSSKLDAALIRVNSADLQPLGLTQSDGTQIRTFSEIAGDGGLTAKSLPFDVATASFAFTAGHYLAELNADGMVWRDVVTGVGADSTFKGGRSGAAWLRGDSLVALQVAGTSPRYGTGYAQIFTRIFDEIASAGETAGIMKLGSLKLICTF